EKARVGPHIAGIGRDEKRQIANQPYSPGVCMVLEALSLSKKQELSQATLLDLLCQVAPGLFKRSRAAMNEFRWPLEVMGPLVPGLERPEKRVIVQPVCLVGAESFEVRPQLSARSGSK